jgi:hypothetical protein
MTEERNMTHKQYTLTITCSLQELVLIAAMLPAGNRAAGKVRQVRAGKKAGNSRWESMTPRQQKQHIKKMLAGKKHA